MCNSCAVTSKFFEFIIDHIAIFSQKLIRDHCGSLDS